MPHTAHLSIAMFCLCAVLSACATPPPQQADDPYAAFRESRPRSILVMPPVNLSPEIAAAATFLATSTFPLAEAGYYVIPPALSNETFRQNGITVADEAHAIAPERLREVFGADAALYITIHRFGASYVVIDSVVEAEASARLVDLRSGEELWHGRSSVVSGSGSGGGDDLLEMLLSAALSQIINTLSDRSHQTGREANYKLLSAGKQKSILYGPYHPKYMTD